MNWITFVISFIFVIHCFVLAINSFNYRNRDILLQHFKLIYQQSFIQYIIYNHLVCKNKPCKVSKVLKEIEFVWTIHLNTLVTGLHLRYWAQASILTWYVGKKYIETVVMLNLLQLSGFNRNRTLKNSTNVFLWCWFHLVQWDTFL